MRSSHLLKVRGFVGRMLVGGQLTGHEVGQCFFYFGKTSIKVDVGGGDNETGLDYFPRVGGGARVDDTGGWPIHVVSGIPKVTKNGTLSVTLLHHLFMF